MNVTFQKSLKPLRRNVFWVSFFYIAAEIFTVFLSKGVNSGVN